MISGCKAPFGCPCNNRATPSLVMLHMSIFFLNSESRPEEATDAGGDQRIGPWFRSIYRGPNRGGQQQPFFCNLIGLVRKPTSRG